MITIKLPSLDSVMNADFAALHNIIRIFKNIMGRPTFPHQHRALSHSEIGEHEDFQANRNLCQEAHAAGNSTTCESATYITNAVRAFSWRAALLKKICYMLHQTSSPELSLALCAVVSFTSSSLTKAQASTANTFVK